MEPAFGQVEVIPHFAHPAIKQDGQTVVDKHTDSNQQQSEHKAEQGPDKALTQTPALQHINELTRQTRAGGFDIQSLGERVQRVLRLLLPGL